MHGHFVKEFGTVEDMARFWMKAVVSNQYGSLRMEGISEISIYPEPKAGTPEIDWDIGKLDL